MGVFKRALISVTQRKVNSIILLVIVFILSNVLLTTLSVNSSIKSTKDSVLSQLTPEVTIDINPKVWESDTAETPKLDTKMVTKLYEKTKDIVKSFDYTQSTGLALPEGMKEAEILSKEQKDELMGGSMINGPSGAIYASISGTQLSIKPEEENAGKLLSGKGFTQSDIEKGSNKILVTKQFAETNNLEIGSNIVLSSEIYNYEEMNTIVGENQTQKPAKIINHDFEICGIVQLTKLEEFISKAKNGDLSKMTDEYFQVSYLGNQIYMPNATVNKINAENLVANKEVNPASEQTDMDKEFVDFVQPKYILKDMKDLNAFKKEALKIFNEEKYSIVSASDAYDIAGKPLKTMGGLLDTIFTITLVASVVILALVLCIFMYLRQKEMGIFLALGERKTKIVGQLLCETLIVALIGATLAIFTSIIFSNMLADSALQSLLTPSNDVMEGMSLSLGSTSTNITPEMISQQYSGGFAIITIFIFYGTMFATIVVAQLATVLYLLRLSPKKILM